jgi:hypothetical protein
MIRKWMLVAVAAAGVIAASGWSAQAGHCGPRGGFGYGYGYGPRYGAVYGRPYGYGYGRPVVVAPRVVPAPVYPYPVAPGYGYGYGYAPYGQAFGLQTGNFSLFLGGSPVSRPPIYLADEARRTARSEGLLLFHRPSLALRATSYATHDSSSVNFGGFK